EDSKGFFSTTSLKEPKTISQALKDKSWVEAMQEELLQFKLQQVWILVDLPFGKKEIGTKWVFRNKRDERSIIVKNKARLVAQGQKQEEGINYDEVFSPVARIEAIRLFLVFASYKGFLVYKMDVKSAFVYGKIKEEVYVHQPPGFVDPAHPNKVYKVVKALYGLHQAPRAWYETLSSFLLENGFRRVYVDDIIFGSTKKSMCTEFEEVMHKRFQMSSMGELTFFLGLQVKQQPDGIFISQDKYVADILKKFDFCSIKTATTPIESNKPLVKDEDGVEVDVHEYRSMMVPDVFDCIKADIMLLSMLCKKDPILGNAKKQTIMANSTTEAEYVAAAHCCGQVLWIQNQIMDYGFNFMNKSLFDNESTIIVVRLIDVLKIHTDSNVADLLTKGFDVTRISMDLRMDRSSPGKYNSSMVWEVLRGLAKEKSTDKGKRYTEEARSMAKKIDIGLDVEEEINNGREEINTGIEEVTYKTKEQIRQEEARLEEAIKLQAQLDEEVAKQIHLDKMIAKRMAEEEALTEQQKKRKAQVEFEA
ncbi:putative ribonuclease H-like domain-containing protein, partial [Tanacetum coccineum]